MHHHLRENIGNRTPEFLPGTVAIDDLALERFRISRSELAMLRDARGGERRGRFKRQIGRRLQAIAYPLQRSSAAIVRRNVPRECGNTIQQVFCDGVDVKSLHTPRPPKYAWSTDAIDSIDEDDIRRIQCHSLAEQLDHSNRWLEHDFQLPPTAFRGCERCLMGNGWAVLVVLFGAHQILVLLQEVRVVHRAVVVDLPPCVAVAAEHTRGPYRQREFLPIVPQRSALATDGVEQVIILVQGVVEEFHLNLRRPAKQSLVDWPDGVPAARDPAYRIVHDGVIAMIPVFGHEVDVTAVERSVELGQRAAWSRGRVRMVFGAGDRLLLRMHGLTREVTTQHEWCESGEAQHPSHSVRCTRIIIVYKQARSPAMSSLGRRVIVALPGEPAHRVVESHDAGARRLFASRR